MKKLKIKIFWTLCIILSLFLITILVIFNFQNYTNAKSEIEKNLFRMNIDKNKDYIPPLIEDDENIDTKTDRKDTKRFMDVNIYTILLDSNNKILDIISHTEDGSINENIKEIALKIISDNKSNNIHIGNLYFESFSYNYNKTNFITIIDNNEVNSSLRYSLKFSILLFILAEIIIFVISQILSNWIIQPVLESFNKQKQFIADASHELKTPLSVIMASAEAIGDCPKEQKWINNIKNESERMSKLITSLLDLTRASQEERQIYEVVDFSKLVEISILTLESLTYEKNIKLDYRIDDHINFNCNSAEMKQLLSILLDNAIKHSCKQGKITINLKKVKNNILLEVINKGDPIPKEEEEKIFERFYRIDKSRNRNDNSYGLGLAIAKSIVENHNGHISASSSEGYTKFTVIFKNKNKEH